MLNLTKLQWVDDRAITEAQRKLMRRKTAKFTTEELNRYEEDHRYHNHSTIRINSKLLIDLQVPTIKEYEDIGIQFNIKTREGVRQHVNKVLVKVSSIVKNRIRN
jgi:hypothetical protein